MGKYNLVKRMMGMMIAVLIMSLTLSSCDTLRKKFTRHKKHGDTEDQTLQPVLEPEIYPAPQENAEQNYKLHYDLIKAWYKDLWTAIDDKSTAKYLHYTIGQVTTHINQMEKLVDVPTQANLVKLAAYLDYYSASLEDSWNTRNISRIQSDLRAFDRFLRDHLRADRIKGHFVHSK